MSKLLNGVEQMHRPLALSFILFTMILSVEGHANLGPSPEKPTQPTKLDFASYLNRCSDALGTPISKFPKIDCSLGGQVQIFKNGVKVEKGAHGDSCDNPSMILNYRSACLPNSWIGTAFTEENKLQWSYLCRQFKSVDEGASTADVVGLIVNNRENGATCFFESKSVGRIDSQYLNYGAIDVKKIPLLQEDLGKSFWKEPTEMVTSSGSDCVTCHSATPFIRTPFLRSLTHEGPQASLPENTNLARKFIKNYWVVADKELQSLNLRRNWTATHMSPTNRETRSCTGCHQVGNGHYCSGIVPYAIGETPMGNWKPKTLIKKHWPHSNLHWTEFETKLKKFTDRNEWERSKFYRAMTKLQQCCSKTVDDDPSCGWVRNPARD